MNFKSNACKFRRLTPLARRIIMMMIVMIIIIMNIIIVILTIIMIIIIVIMMNIIIIMMWSKDYNNNDNKIMILLMKISIRIVVFELKTDQCSLLQNRLFNTWKLRKYTTYITQQLQRKYIRFNILPKWFNMRHENIIHLKNLLTANRKENYVLLCLIFEVTIGN